MRGLDAWLTTEPETYFDPHSPWSSFVDHDGYATLLYGTGDRESDVIFVYGKGADAVETAERVALRLNDRPQRRFCCVADHGFCIVCGDLVVEPGVSVIRPERLTEIPVGDGKQVPYLPWIHEARYRLVHEYPVT